MAELLTAAQMRAIEAAAIASGRVTGLELMERAGAGVVAAVLAEWPELAQSPHKAVVLCGPGNNGGDGFVIARLLKQRGWDVAVFLYGDGGKLPPDAKTNHARWGEMGDLHALGPTTAFPPSDLCVDALFGTGLTRPMPDLPRPDAPRMVAVDIPSGLCADSGRVLGAGLRADLTVAFHAAKLGHILSQGPARSGKLVVADIGLSGGGLPLVAPPFAGLGKSPDAHKYAHGHALILSGPSGRTGAARLAARAALRAGAGLVTVATPHDALAENAAQLTAIMLTEVDTPEALTETLKDSRIGALCLGPAFGTDRASAFLPAVIAAQRPTVLDADALTALSQTGFDGLHDTCVLTPHAGEFARLFPDIAAKLADPATTGPADSKLDATREAAKRAGCTVLFKGPDSVIASPDGRASIHAAAYDRAAPWLATAGSGDVLAGLIAGLLARGLDPQAAAETAAYLHVEAALSFGPGLIAEDLPEALPKVLRALLSSL